MAAAWFIWRSQDAVRDQWNPGRMGWRMWVPLPPRRSAGPPGPRWKLKIFGKATLADVFEQARLPGSSSQQKMASRSLSGGSPARMHNPYDRLKLALQTGLLEATWGSRRETGFQAISACYWLREFDAEAKPKPKPKPNVATRLSNASKRMTVAFRFSPGSAKRNKRLNPIWLSDPNNIETFDLPDLSEVEPSKLPIAPEDKVSSLSAAARTDESEASDGRRQQDATESHQDNLDGIYMLVDDVKRVERELSQREYEGEDWDLR